tara:strand:+ start:325 stop:2496 length:2172 start_codon:yes stop_codon:yes gene_type:complete
MHCASLLDGLNDKQQQAVTAPMSNLLVLAGAGSGKTRVLTHRIAWLLQEQQQYPSQILAVTFTNKAAHEMRTRIHDLIGAGHHSMWVGTFHSLAHRLLRLHYREINLPENFQIIDSDDQLRMIKRAIQALNLDEKRWAPKQAQSYINNKKDAGLYPQHVETTYKTDATWLSIYSAYQESCDRAGLIDFADLLLKAHRLWLDCPHILEHYQNRFKHILVDEFQDTNQIQYAWIKLLAGHDNHVMIVGDDDQSIYGWRGAQVENLNHFLNDFTGAQIIRLEQNYRSSAHILNASNALIAHNPERLGKQLWTEVAEGERITVYQSFNELDEARFIMQEIKTRQAQGHALSDFAILYRSNAQSRVLEEACMQHHLAYRIYGGMRFFDRQEIKDAMSYLRLIANRSDDAAFERIVNTPTRGIGGRTLDTIRAYAREQGFTLWQASVTLIQNQSLAGRAASAISQFVDLIHELDQESTELSLRQTVELCTRQSGLLAMYQQEKGEKAKSRVENLAELVTAADSFILPETEDDEPLQELSAFLAYAVLESSERQADEQQAAVQLMTMHSAKGLEFPIVFIAGAEEGLFPNQQAVDMDQRLDEERRLCYVGMTRAEQKLYFTYATSRRIYGRVHDSIASRFIKEIPEQHVTFSQLKARVQPLQSASRKQHQMADEVLEDGLKVGQRVRHPKFGPGVIIGYEGTNKDMRIHVNFESNGSKWLVQTYARLQPI